MIKKTFEHLNKVDKIYGKLIKVEGFEQTKLGYAFKRFSEKNLVKFFKEYHQELTDMYLDNALTDEKTKAVLLDEKNPRGGFQFSKDGLKEALKKEREIEAKFNDREFDVEPYICKDLGDTKFNAEEKELLEDLIISTKK